MDKLSSSVLEITKSNYKEYGSSVIEQRALPDFRDGLKPVGRRIIWSMHKMGLLPTSNYVKCARVVGYVMGAHHPHGDMSIFQTLVNMTQHHMSKGIVDGEGNFGNYMTEASAMRYVECKLSKYAKKCFLQPEYLAVTPMVDNYDGKEKEPLYLPALLPNLVLNGASGIAVGTKCGIPPLELEALLPVLQKMLDGEDVSIKTLKKHIKFNWRYGGVYDSTEEDLVSWLTEGSGTLGFISEFNTDEDNKIIAVTVPPNFNWETIVNRLANMQEVASFNNLSSYKNKTKDGIKFVVQLKNTISDDKYDDVYDKVKNLFRNSVQLATNVTKREDANNVSFISTNLGTMLKMWIDYRVDLELRAQKNILDELNKKLAYQELLLLACNNKDIIIKALDNSHPEKIIAQKLKITEQQADTILSLQIRTLSRMSQTTIKTTMEKIEKDKSITKKHIAKPSAKVKVDIADLAGAI
jgi:DNA gyrase/topoisomerase IV subunit A